MHLMKLTSFSKLHLPHQLLLMLAIILPLLWGIIALDLNSRRDLSRANSERHVGNLVMAISEEVRASVTAIDHSLLSLRDEWLRGGEPFEQAVRRWTSRLEREMVSQIAILDTQGILQYSSLHPAMKGTDLSDREHYRIHRSSSEDRLFVSKPLLGRVSGVRSVQLTRPLLDQAGKFYGVIVLSVQPEFFARFYHSLKLDEGTIIMLARQSGEILAKSPENQDAIGKHVEDLGYRFNLDDSIGVTASSRNELDEGDMYGWRLLPQGELMVSLKQPLRVLMSDYLQHRNIMLAGGAGISLLLALVCYILLVNWRERARATSRILQSEVRMKYALQGAGDTVWDWNLQTDAMSFSNQWVSMLGYTDTDAPKRRSEWEKLVHPDDVGQTRAALLAHLEDDATPYRSEHRMRARNGSWVWILERGAAVTRTPEGRPLRMVGTHTDITQTKQSEAALHQSLEQIAMDRQRMRSILENSYDAFLGLDDQGRISEWNQQAEHTFGWTAQEAMGKTLVELIIPPARRPDYDKIVSRIRQGKQAALKGHRFEFTALHKNGREIPIELALAIMPARDGLNAHAFIRDISDRLEAERKEQQRMHSLEEARSALFHAQKLEAVGKLTGGVAHDFNNMLQIISGNLQLLQLEFSNNEMAASRLQSAVKAVSRGAKLSSQLLAFARRQPLQPVVVNINRMIIGMHDLLRQALPESIEIGINATGDARAVLIDPHQLENVLINLAINASHAMKGKGQLTIAVSDVTVSPELMSLHPNLAVGEYVKLTVSDNGAGMTEEVRQRAFEPFFTTKPEGEGTGLGLSMAYGFVRQSGGHIQIDSEMGKGTSIAIYMPRVSIAEIPVLAREENPLAPQGDLILVVEDDLEVQSATVSILKALGYEVRKADNAKQALEIIEQDAGIDLLFTDVVMPGAMNGPELADKAREIRSDLSVLFTSGYTREAVGVQNILKPDINLLQKPYHYQQLAVKLRQMLGRGARKVA